MREMTDRLAADPELAAALPRRARGLPRRAATPSRCCRDAGIERRRDARPGQVPARPGRRTRSPPGRGVNPLGDEALGAAARVVGRPGPCATSPRRRTHDAGRGDRLRHELDPAAGRRRRPGRRRRWSTCDRADGDRPARRGRRPTGRLAPEALERTCAALRASTPRRMRGTWVPTRSAWSPRRATRDAANRDGLRATGSATRSGVEPEVVTGDEEAELSFAGATARSSAAAAAAPFLVVDIGGGSTEFVLGDGRCAAARSVDIGCVRLTERHLHADPPTAEQVRRSATSAPRSTVAADVPSPRRRPWSAWPTMARIMR